MIAACELAKRRYVGAARPLRPGDGARGRAGRGSSTPSACCARRSRRCRTAATRPSVGWLDDDGVNRGVKLPGQGRGRDRRRRDHVRPDRVERRGPDRLQLPVRGHDRLGDDLHHADDLPRRGDLPGLRAAERGDARAGQRHRAEGLDLQPELPARVLRPLLPGAARRRPRAARARAGDARTRSPPATPRTSTSSPTRASSRRRASTGSTSRSTRAPTAAGPDATGSTPSTA